VMRLLIDKAEEMVSALGLKLVTREPTVSPPNTRFIGEFGWSLLVVGALTREIRGGPRHDRGSTKADDACVFGPALILRLDHELRMDMVDRMVNTRPDLMETNWSYQLARKYDHQ